MNILTKFGDKFLNSYILEMTILFNKAVKLHFFLLQILFVYANILLRYVLNTRGDIHEIKR